MSDVTPPPAEAIAAQQAFDAATAEVQRVNALMPSSLAVGAGDASIPDELRAEWKKAWDARMDALWALREAKNWVGNGGPKAAEAALRLAARGGEHPQGAA
ncbi:hypothetical protein ABZ897_01035 [Nonomuraea sp. NPDC046802]|uniref:hypothetical protein n=1 Tax=Nonomuraea sp. NPDC046802 TaxID=3154919 RepID=UPI0033EDBC03